MSKYLIVNADDFGMCKSANEAVFDLFEKGKLFSSTIMLPCPAAVEAVEYSKAHPEYAIGVHLTLTSEWKNYRWKTLTDAPSLTDEEGFMWHNSKQVQKNGKTKEIEKEVRAQIEYAHSLGMKPSHIDNHMGSLYGHQTGRFGLARLTLKIMGEYGYAYRAFTKTDKSICPNGTPYPIYRLAKYVFRGRIKKYNIVTPDYLLFPDWGEMNKKIVVKVSSPDGGFYYDLDKDSYRKYRDEILRIWKDIPDGVTETFLHPAKETDELKSITGSWYQRIFEYRLMDDDYTHEYLKEHGIKLISYRELIKMKKK